MNYPALTDGASPPRGEDFLLLPGNLLYTPSEKDQPALADLLPVLARFVVCFISVDLEK